MYLVALEQDIISSHFSKKSTWEEALIEIKLPSNYPYNDVIKCSNPGWFAIIQSIGHQYNSPNSTKHGAFMGCGFTSEVDGLKKVYNKCPFCSDASSLTAKWGYFNPAKIKEAGSYELDVNACDIRFKTNDIYPQYTDGKCDVNIVKQMYQ